MNMGLSKDTCCCHITHWLIDCKNGTNSLSWSLSTLFAKCFFLAPSCQQEEMISPPLNMSWTWDLFSPTDCGRNDGLPEAAFHVSAFS